MYGYHVSPIHLINTYLLGLYCVPGIEHLVMTKTDGVLALLGEKDL